MTVRKRRRSSRGERGGEAPAGVARTVAVLDIGATAIRMAIAEISSEGEVRTLETLVQEVNLGKDTFTTGTIGKQTIEDCVRVLRSYGQLLREYGVRSDQIRVVATSAVREADNRLAFVDRVYIATGIEIEPTEEAEVNRITFLGIQPFLETEPELLDANTLITEVGGGSTEVLLVRRGDVVFSHAYRLGSLRLREQLQTYRAPPKRARAILESQIRRIIDQVVQQLPATADAPFRMVCLGGDIRFAADQFVDDWRSKGIARVSLADLETLTDELLQATEEQIVAKYHLSFPDAETVGPALLCFLMFGQALQLDSLLATDVNLRDGLLHELAIKGGWNAEFNEQVLRSAIELGKKFQFDEPHARHVAALAGELFDFLQPEHQLDPKYRLLVQVAALLHEVGLFVSQRSYHKHSMYVINNGELFGLRRHELLLTALIARYHRRAAPKPTHEGYLSLDREGRIAVAKLAAILRVADALDRSHSQRVQQIKCSRGDGRLIVAVPHLDDLSLEQLALQQKGPLFESVFGMQVLLRKTRGEPK